MNKRQNKSPIECAQNVKWKNNLTTTKKVGAQRAK
jgi:hypothetical protein